MRISLIPDWVVQDYSLVTVQRLRQQGVRLLLTDLDYTLAPKSVAVADASVADWVKEMQTAGIEVVVVSNNRNPARGPLFCESLHLLCIDHANKPNPRSFRRAMEYAGCTPQETVMLGDKLLTDVLGAHRAGIPVIMVEPKGGAKTLWQKVLHALQEPFKNIARRRSV